MSVAFFIYAIGGSTGSASWLYVWARDMLRNVASVGSLTGSEEKNARATGVGEYVATRHARKRAPLRLRSHHL